MSDDAESTASGLATPQVPAKRNYSPEVLAHRFKPGQSGNPAGRKKGSRNKLGEDFITALYEDFQEHGATAISAVRTKSPHHYLKVIAQVIPQEVVHRVADGLSDDELERRLQHLASVLGYIGDESRDAGASGGEEAPEGPIQTLDLSPVQ